MNAATSALIAQELTQALAESEEGRLYALVDPAQDAGVIGRIAQDAAANACLFGYALDVPIAKTTPRLVQIDRPESSSVLQWVARKAPARPVATLLISRWSLEELTAHLQQQMDAQLEGLDSMFLALWDPAILATLVGMTKDTSLHVPGPVLTEAQRQSLLVPISHWWYWNRNGNLFEIKPPEPGNGAPQNIAPDASPPLLSSLQVDQLVEASVPDHVLHFVELNQPQLLRAIPVPGRYERVRSALAHARQIGLNGMRDLVNFVCVDLIYGRRMQTEPEIGALLQRVAQSRMTLDEALPLFP